MEVACFLGRLRLALFEPFTIGPQLPRFDDEGEKMVEAIRNGEEGCMHEQGGQGMSYFEALVVGPCSWMEGWKEPAKLQSSAGILSKTGSE